MPRPECWSLVAHLIADWFDASIVTVKAVAHCGGVDVRGWASLAAASQPSLCPLCVYMKSTRYEPVCGPTFGCTSRLWLGEGVARPRPTGEKIRLCILCARRSENCTQAVHPRVVPQKATTPICTAPQSLIGTISHRNPIMRANVPFCTYGLTPGSMSAKMGMDTRHG
jgi:hypothetical protein